MSKSNFTFQEFNDELRQKVLDFFNVREAETICTQASQATQSQGAANVLFCKLCEFQAETTSGLMIHVGEMHTRCEMCKKAFVNESSLNEHIEKDHTEMRCSLCEEMVPAHSMRAHRESHKEKAGFKKVLEEVGKIRRTEKEKTEKVDKRKAYKAFIEERKVSVRADVDRRHNEMSSREKSQTVVKMIAEEWREKTAAEKNDYGRKAIAAEQRRAGEKERGENVFEMNERDLTDERLAKCLLCGKLCNGEQRLMRHMTGHKTPVEDMTLLVDELADEFEPELEEVPIEPTKHELVLVKVGDDQWPGKVLEKTTAGTSIKIQLFDKEKSQIWKSPETITPYQHNKHLSSGNQVLKTAFADAKRYERAQNLIE